MSDEQGQVAVKIYGDASAVNSALDSVIAKVEGFATETGQALKSWGVGADKAMSAAAQASARYSRALDEVEARTNASLNRLAAAHKRYNTRVAEISKRFDRDQVSQEAAAEAERGAVAERGAAQRVKVASEAQATIQKVKQAADRALLVGQEQMNAKVLRLDAQLARAQGDITKAAEQTRRAVLAEANAKIIDDRLKESAALLDAETKYQRQRQEIEAEASARMDAAQNASMSRKTKAFIAEAEGMEAAETQYQAARLRTQQEADAQALKLRQEYALRAAQIAAAGNASETEVEETGLSKSLAVYEASQAKAMKLVETTQAKMTAATEKAEARRLAIIEKGEAAGLTAFTAAQTKYQALLEKDEEKAFAILSAGAAKRKQILADSAAAALKVQMEAADRNIALWEKTEAETLAIQTKAKEQYEALLESAGAAALAQQEGAMLAATNILREGEARAVEIEASQIRSLEALEREHAARKLELQAQSEAEVQGATGKSTAILESIEAEKNATLLAAEREHQAAMSTVVAEGVKKREGMERMAAEVAEAEAKTAAGVGAAQMAGRGGHGGGAYNLRHAGFGLMVTAGLLAAPVVEAMKSYTEFDAQLHKIMAQAGERLLSFNDLQKRTLQLSRQLGVAPATVASTLFNDESAGFHGDAAFAMSKSSLRLGIATRSKPEDAANVLTKLLTAYSKPASDAPKISDKLVSAVGLSHTDMSHFGPAVANAAQDFAQAHIDIDSFLAALATVTRIAPNANISSTGLRNFASHLVRPTPAMNKAFNAYGLGEYANGNAPTEFQKPGGFDRFIERAKAATRGNSAAMADIFPDLRTERGAFPLFGRDEQGRGFKEVHAEQKNSAGASGRAYDEQNKSFERKLERFHATANSFMMEFVGIARGMAEPVIEKLIGLGNRLIDGWNHLPEGGKKAIVAVAGITTGLLALVGVIATVGFFVEPIMSVFKGLGLALFGMAARTTAAGEAIAAVPGLLATLSGPVGWITAAVVALGIAWATNLGGIRDKTRPILEAVKKGFLTVFGEVVSFVRGVLAEMTAFWKAHRSEILTITHGIFEIIHGMLSQVLGIFLTVWPLIAGVVKSAWAGIVLAFRVVKTVLLGIIITLLDLLSGHWSRWWSDMKKLAQDMGPDLAQAFQNIFAGIAEGVTGTFRSLIANVKGMWYELVNELKNHRLSFSDIMDAGNKASIASMADNHTGSWMNTGTGTKPGAPTGKGGGAGSPFDVFTSRGRVAGTGAGGIGAGSIGGGGKAPAGVPSWETSSAAASAYASVMRKFGELKDHCGDFITALVAASGAARGFTASAGANNPALRIRPDAQGNYPAGTLFHLGAGGKGTTRHYTSTDDGTHLLEDLTTGNSSDRHGRVSRSRTVNQIRGRILQAYLPTPALAQAWNQNHAAPSGSEDEMQPPPNAALPPGYYKLRQPKVKSKAGMVGSTATPVAPLFPSTAPSVAAILGFANAYTKADAALLKLSTTAGNVKLKLTALDNQEAHQINLLGKHAGQVAILNAQLAVNAQRHTVLTQAEAAVNKEITTQAAKTRDALLHWHSLNAELNSHAAAIKKVNAHRSALKPGSAELAVETAHVVRMNAAYAKLLAKYHDAQHVFVQQDAAMKRYGSELQFVREKLDSVAKSSGRMNQSLDHASGKAERDALAKIASDHQSFFRGQAADKSAGASFDTRRDALSAEAGQIAKDYGLSDEKISGQTAVQLRDTIASLNDKAPAATLALADLDTVITRLGQVDASEALGVTSAARLKLQAVTGNASLTKGGKADGLAASLSSLAQANVPDVDSGDPAAVEAALRAKNASLGALYQEYYAKIGVYRKEDADDQFQEYIAQTEASRKALLDRALHYGLDREAFKSALADKAAELEKRLLGDVALEGISQASILALVQQRLDGERAAYAAADADHKAALKTQLDQDTAVANQLAQTFGAGQQAQKKWSHDFDGTEKVARQVGERIGNDLGDMVTKSGHHMESLKNIMRDTFAEILKQIIVKFVEGAIMQMARVGFNKLEGPQVGGDQTAQGKASAVAGVGSVVSSFLGKGGGGGGGTGGLMGAAMGAASTVAGLFGAHSRAAGPADATPAAAAGGSAGEARGEALGGGEGQRRAAAVGGVQEGTGAVGAAASAGGGLTRVFGSGLGGALGKALPVIGGVMALASLASSLFGQSKPDYVNKTGQTQFASVAGRDYTASLDSGYSGDSGMRQVLRAHEDAITRMTAMAAMPQTAVHFEAGAVQVNGIHPGNTQQVADALTPVIQQRMSSNAGIHAAATGTGVS